MINLFRFLFEKKVFGVSSWIGDRFGIKASWIRLLFIYASFTNVLTVLFYLIMVFILKLSNHFKYKKRKSVFDL
tara:strand:- start:3139 stop:3360 length:222 start_codon:yes stop_codon:yes gene_type:complete